MGCDSEFYNKINKLTDFISESNSIVFFGGAGVSTESQNKVHNKKRVFKTLQLS